ncbi:ribonuclease Z [Eisenibacter elegans]|jgi:ribonuclease Z|uniref:ribonuclease Z n=1 Tax=Eisenibacter elegans TaxID=997 RepID=UPI000416B381|nr:ribonuclease Z [Eisenibacter elegans]
MFEITILGNGAATPTHQSNPSAQYIQLDNQHLLIDCGEATQIQMMRYGIKSQKISHIFISHLHGDHYWGLMGLLSSWHLQGRKTPVYLYAPRALDEIIRLQLKASQTILNYALHFSPIPADSPCYLVETPSFSVQSFPLKHRIDCTGFVVRERPDIRYNLRKEMLGPTLGKAQILALKQGQDTTDTLGKPLRVDQYTYKFLARSYAYCSDTMPDEAITPYLHGVDLLYHETTFLHQDLDKALATLHSTAQQAAQVAHDAQVKRLLMGHFSVRYEKPAAAFEAEARRIFAESYASVEGHTYHIDSQAVG